ncbi:hypothetical protein WA026_006739, partial [Henosepilachna vigintioctopunctata]
IRAIKREHCRQFTSEMEQNLYGAQRKVWKMLRNRKKPVNEYVQTEIISPDIWEKYCTELYQDEETTETWVNEDETPDDVLITEEELRKRIEKLKNRKAAGTDNIPNELLKYGKKKLI